MADHDQTTPRPMTNPTTSAFLSKLQSHTPNSTQLIAFLSFVISGAILLCLSGITLTVSVLGLVLFTPLIIFSSPIWVPLAFVLFVAVAGFLSICGFSLAIFWIYRYFSGLHPPGSDRVDYARSRIYDTANHVKDYAREYGGYWQTKVKDAAPGA